MQSNNQELTELLTFVSASNHSKVNNLFGKQLDHALMNLYSRVSNVENSIVISEFVSKYMNDTPFEPTSADIGNCDNFTNKTNVNIDVIRQLFQRQMLFNTVFKLRTTHLVEALNNLQPESLYKVILDNYTWNTKSGYSIHDFNVSSIEQKPTESNRYKYVMTVKHIGTGALYRLTVSIYLKNVFIGKPIV